MAGVLRRRLRMGNIRIETGLRVAYGYEVGAYLKEPRAKPISYQTDLALVEELEDDAWLPRVIIEAKLRSFGTHGAITYGKKSEAHGIVHPYLRYGVMLSDRGDFDLPGR